MFWKDPFSPRHSMVLRGNNWNPVFPLSPHPTTHIVSYQYHGIIPPKSPPTHSDQLTKNAKQIRSVLTEAMFCTPLSLQKKPKSFITFTSPCSDRSKVPIQFQYQVLRFQLGSIFFKFFQGSQLLFPFVLEPQMVCFSDWNSGLIFLCLINAFHSDVA